MTKYKRYTIIQGQTIWSGSTLENATKSLQDTARKTAETEKERHLHAYLVEETIDDKGKPHFMIIQ